MDTASMEGGLVSRCFYRSYVDLLIAMENGTTPTLAGRDNLKTMAVVDACYLSAKEKRAVDVGELLS